MGNSTRRLPRKKAPAQRGYVALQCVVALARLLLLCSQWPGGHLVEWVRLVWPAATGEGVSAFLRVVVAVGRWLLERYDAPRRGVRRQRRDKKRRRR